jgi:site-specific DNA recombinase
MSREEIQYIVATLTNLATTIQDADPRDKAEIYNGLGLRLTYHPGRAAVLAEARPASAPVCVKYVSEEQHSR